MLGMNRLQLELDRLYALGANATDGTAGDGVPASHQQGIRALVLELTRPASWEQLASVWKGVQSDLALPAPAIAVSGGDGLQVWFSFASPISPSAAERFLHGLRARYLSGVASTQVRLIRDKAELPLAPPVEVGTDRWSAFVTPDLASIFADTPWLDIPPNDEGQAAILRALEPIRPAAFDAALVQLGAIDGAEPGATSAATPSAAAAARTREQGDLDPARFLASVMNDETAPLAVRVEAAKALLGHWRGS
jgi:hypothetical protein